jgi:hypothetical protein
LSLRDFFSPEPGDAATSTETSASLRAQQLRKRRKSPERPKPPAGREPSRKGKDKDDDLDEYCRELLAELEERCPGLLPTGPLPPGEVADPIEIKQPDLEKLILKAFGVGDKRKRNTVIWEQAGSELLVHLKKTRIAVLEGMVLVGLTVQTIETETVEITVPFAVGRPDRLAGMVVTAEAQPRGPSVIVDLWGESLTAAAWQALLDVVSTIAARTGVDDAGTPLLPGAIVAAQGRLGVIPQAGHVFEGPIR